jgi:proteasome assembly chaperone 3
MTATISSDEYVVTPTAYPARTDAATLTINGLETTARIVNFTDKILITVTQKGRLAHWVREQAFACTRIQIADLENSGTRSA